MSALMAVDALIAATSKRCERAITLVTVSQTQQRLSCNCRRTTYLTELLVFCNYWLI